MAVLSLMIAVEGVFIGLLLWRMRAAKGAAAASPESAVTKALGAAQTPALPEHMPSVTEHTTRAFGPSYAERGAAKR